MANNYNFIFDKSFPSGKNSNLQEFFKKHKRLNNIGIFIYKYIHIYRIILIIRNKVSIDLRYVRNFIIKYTKLFKYWMIFEKFITFFFSFLFEYFRYVIFNVYLWMKVKFINREIQEIICVKIQLLFLICLTKGIIPFMLVVLIILLIKLINIKLIKWATGYERFYYSFSFIQLIRVFNMYLWLLNNLNFS